MLLQSVAACPCNRRRRPPVANCRAAAVAARLQAVIVMASPLVATDQARMADYCRAGHPATPPLLPEPPLLTADSHGSNMRSESQDGRCRPGGRAAAASLDGDL